jgi:flagellar basal-body rod modification protein FlgD
MAAITDVMAAVNGTKSDTAKTGVQNTEDRFLKLLVTQMKNQDPLNPLDNAQVTSQMAQLSTVSGIEKLNTSLEAMSQSFMANQSLQAANMIGHSVLAPGNTLTLKDGTAIAGLDLQGAADKVEVTIRDKAGFVVQTVDLGSQKAGSLPFAWDGKDNGGNAVADGEYTFDVKATAGTDKVTVDKLALGQVTSVTLGTSGVKLDVAGMGSIEAAKVKQIF